MGSEFDIAIVGMACRLPGARNLEEFWRNLAGGVESISRLSDEEILASGVPEEFLRAPNYVKAAPLLDEPGAFDAAFFGFSPAEARALDPQQRILLELAHEALENAGYDPERYRGRIGVFTGAAMNTYFTNVGLFGRLAEDYIPTLIGNDKDFLSTRISYKLNLKGPSITVQTACSTSMVAVHLARQSLLSGESDMALAGAISVRVPHRAGYLSDPGGVVSPDGHVRAFDAKANGTVFGSGGGILVLKRYDDAVADGDAIRAVIKGSAVNNDGSEKAGYTAPSVNSQADVVVEALANAGIGADEISYVEAHGSGTPVGDPIEIKALTKAFRSATQRAGYCAIGSVKTNVGHLDVAAAVTGMIKTVLALEHRQLPPTLHFTEANPEIDFPSTPFYVNTELREWVSDGPRRAGVMSTGMGGTNAHVVLEEAPVADRLSATGAAQLFILSAKTEAALDAAQANLREVIKAGEALDMAAAAYTLQVGRKPFAQRRYFVASSRQHALNALDGLAALEPFGAQRIFSGRAADERRPLVFLLPGIGDHYVGMAHGLYENWPVFKAALDRCAALLVPELGCDILSLLYPASQSWKRSGTGKGIDLKKMLGRQGEGAHDAEAQRLNRTLFAQPALFAIEYATACLWQSLGITADAIVGHSMGEYVAACLAGVLSLEDALYLIAARAKLVDALPQGAMLAVALPEAELTALLPEELSIALINGANLCVVAGPVAAVAQFEKTLSAQEIIYRPVQNGHAFHSKMLEPMAQAFADVVAGVRLHEPRLPYVSNVTGAWITKTEATSPAYWARHATHTARFNDAVQQVWQLDNPILLEVGPGRTLGVLAGQHPARPAGATASALASIRHHYDQQSDGDYMLHAIGKLWLSGAAVQWEELPTASRRRVALPSYPFEHQNFWLAPLLANPSAAAKANAVADKPGVDGWFYAPIWEPKPFALERIEASLPEDAFWLIVDAAEGGAEPLRGYLQARQQQVGLARLGRSFVNHGDGSFELNGTAVDDYVKLFRALAEQPAKAIHIVFMASCQRADAPAKDDRELGFYSLLFMAQAIGEANLTLPITIGLITNRVHEVTGEETLQPDMATVLGPCGVIPKELPNVQCFNIDLAIQRSVEELSAATMAALVGEFYRPPRARVIAYRGRYRWQKGYRQVSLPAPAALNGALPSQRLRRGGVYLITGGTGGIGLSICKYLAQACQPTLVLTKQQPFPAKSQWQELLAAGTAPSRQRRIIASLCEIEQLGAKVEVVVAEAADREAMGRVINEAQQEHGALHGVIHAAGIVRAGLIQTKSQAEAAAVLAPKVTGTDILYDLVKDVGLDFFVLFSSITAVITPYAEADYSAANAYLDAFAHYANAHSKFHTLAINWPGWKEIGQLADLEVKPGLEAWKQAALDKAIVTADGVAAFRRALASDLTQVIVSPEALQRVIEEAELPFDHTKYLSTGATTNGNAAAAHNDSEKKQLPAAQDVEAVLSGIWQQVLGFDEIDPQDNFSQLGGHSLLAMQIVAQMRSAFGIGFTVREFFAAPSIAQASALVRTRVNGNGNGATTRETPARLLVAPMGQRLLGAAGSRHGLFFGPSERRLFAMYHPPRENAGCRDGRVLTVLCPPLLREYMRTHLALRELAIGLTERGHHVLRFDFFGTGDSMGELEDVTLAHWLADIALAVRQGRELSGCNVVRLLAVRASALLAGKSFAACGEVERWVFWDPVADGAGYLESLRQIQAVLAARDTALSQLDLAQSVHEYAGYRLSPSLVAELRSLNASAYTDLPKSHLRIVTTNAGTGALVPGVAPEVAPFACQWESDSEDLMMPKPVLERLITCLA